MNETLYACLTKQPSHEHLTKHYGGGDVSNIHIARAAFLNGITWPQNSTIKIAFMKQGFDFESEHHKDSGYTKEKADWVQHIVETNVVPLINLKFEWDVPLQDSDVRISFVKALGSFSYLGIQPVQLKVPKDTITMNLGWTDEDVASSDSPELADTGVNIIHEFGHLLGMIHEHSRADADLHWNKSVVYKSLGDPPNNWDKQMCDDQIFKQYALSSFNGSKYDKYSVMHYVFPSKFFKTDPHLVVAKGYSELDKVWINKKYPGKTLVNSEGGDSVGGDSVGGGNWLDKNWYLILIGVIICILYVIISFHQHWTRRVR